MLLSQFETFPAVYAVGKNYQIMVSVTRPVVMWVRVGDKNFYDDSNGILRSACTTHRMIVPMELLDVAGEYTICFREVYDRKPYFAELSDVMEYTRAFRPVKEDGVIHIYHIADAHNKVQEPVAAGNYFGDALDLLVLNGDIPNHSGKLEYFTAIHEIAGNITKGEIPVIFSRGNHDMRGIYAEKLEEYVPTDCGRSYYTFRLGRIWGMVLDCGEDKRDDNEEYGHTVCCEDFRCRQTEFIRNVIANAKDEYEAEGVKNRIVICHYPFTDTLKFPFDIEVELFTQWARLLRENVKPQLLLFGHMHEAYVSHPGDEHDKKGQPCAAIVASEVRKDAFLGGAIELDYDRCTVKFTDTEGVIKTQEEIIF